MSPRLRRHLVRDRIAEAAREIGTLLITLAPLDWVLADVRVRGQLLLFFVAGVFLLGSSILVEWRRSRAD